MLSIIWLILTDYRLYMPNVCEKSHIYADSWIKLKENGGK